MSFKNLGIVGLSEGNGHPFSFSSIINGYSDEGLANSGWDVIYDYITKQDTSEFGFKNVSVTHAWTQNEQITQKLCEACLIPNKVFNIEDLIGKVDAVIIARDDYENHFRMAKIFLDKNIPVFVDKPLSIKLEELKYFKKYLENGLLMSCSGLRYAAELDSVRSNLSDYGQIKLIKGVVVNNWEQYGIHLLESILSTTKSRAISILPTNANHSSYSIKLDNDAILQLDSIRDIPKTFLIDIWGTKKRSSHEISDNFTAFRRTIWHFINLIENRFISIDANETIELMKIIIAGKIARSEKREVLIKEIII